MKDYRDRARGLADLLNYGLMIDDGTLLLKDGAFCAGWSYAGPDMHLAEQSERIILRLAFNQAFSQLGDGWMLHSNLIRKAIEIYPDVHDNHFPDATSTFIDQERRAHFQKKETHFISETHFVLTYKPPLEIALKFKPFFIESNEPGGDNLSGWNDALTTFQHKIKQVENSLSKILTLKRLRKNDILSHLHACLTGLHHPMTHPRFPVYLDQVLASNDFLGGCAPKVGQKHLIILSVTGFPLESYPSMLQHLSELPISFRWSNRFIFLDSTTAIQSQKKYRRYWFQKQQGLMGLVRQIVHAESVGFLDQDALEMADDADSAVAETESHLIHYGYYTSTFILMDEDEVKLRGAAKLLTQALEKKGFATRKETINAVEAYLGSLPGHGYQNIRKPMVSTFNLTDFLPLLSLWDGCEHHPSPYYPKESPPLLYAQTQGKTPFRFSLHVDDVGHTLVVGDTGSGKSTLLGFLIAQHLRYPRAQIFMFDKGYSSFTLCHALQGVHYDIAGDNQSIAFAPLQHINTEIELDWACEWLEIVYQSQGVALCPIQRKEIRQSLQRMANQPSKTLTDLQASLQDHTLKAALEFYTLSGTMGQLLDADVDQVRASSLQVFEMQHLLNKDEKFALPVLHYLFHQINRRLDVSQPSLIIIEEGHRFLKGHFGQQLEVWLRECRKQNAAVVFVTQGLAEIVHSPYAPILLNSCPTKLFLPNPSAHAAYNKALYHQIGLSERHIELIQQGIPKQDYFLISPKGNRLMDLALSKGFLAFMDSTNSESRAKILALKDKYNTEWVYHFLIDKNLHKEAEQWRHEWKIVSSGR
jgi:type IV secretion system protein TrbE